MDEALLDTDILSVIFKAKNPQVLNVGRQYLAQHQRFAFSAITLYEVIRGLRANRAVGVLAKFLKLADNCDVLPISLPVLMRAADLWAEARQRGLPRDDADVIIAATALEAHRVLVTGNSAHFTWISGLSLTDWRHATS